MDFFKDFLLYFNIIGGFICGAVNLIYIHQNPKYSWMWIKWGYAGLGFYWCIVYTYLAIFPQNLLVVREMLRPGIALGIALMMAGSFVRLEKFYLPDLIKNIIRKKITKMG